MARVTTLGALTASIAHEVNQPLSGIITNASTSLLLLADVLLTSPAPLKLRSGRSAMPTGPPRSLPVCARSSKKTGTKVSRST